MLGYTGGAWHPVGPHLPAALNGQQIRVLRLTRASHGDVALLAAGTAPSARLLAAWTSDGGQHWALSPVLRAGMRRFPRRWRAGGGLGVVLAGKRAEIVAVAGSPWQPDAGAARRADRDAGPAARRRRGSAQRGRPARWSPGS